MSGSSRTLIRSLEAVFSNWEGLDSVDLNSPTLTPEISDVLATITVFHEKHNTLQSIKQSTDLIEQLFRIYDTFVKPTLNLAKEILFVEILTKLWPFFVGDEALLWLDTYLKPAVDSAGYDLQFVHKSREFIKTAMAVDVMHTEDPLLASRRVNLGLRVVEKVVHVYLGDNDCTDADLAPDDDSTETLTNSTLTNSTSLAAEKDTPGQVSRRLVIGLLKREAQVNTHEYLENLRYIRMNCKNLLMSYGLKNAKGLVLILNPLISSNLDVPLPSPTSRTLLPSGAAADRLDTLNLLAALVSQDTRHTRELVRSTSILETLLRVARRPDGSVAISILCMILPQTCTQVGRYLSDMFLVFQTAANSSSVLEYDLHCFIALLYGLFPVNICSFAQDPSKYLHANPPKIKEHFEMGDSNLGSDKIQNILKGFKLHPTFMAMNVLDLNKNALAEEIQSPIKWLLNSYKDEDITWEEVMLSCLGFSPELALSVPDYITEPTGSRLGKQSSVNLQSPLIPFNSRSSSVGALYMTESKASLFQKHVLNNRKMSLVNSDGGHDVTSTKGSRSSVDIRFNDVNFGNTSNDSSSNNILESASESGYRDESNEVLNDLFLNHEKLYVGSKISKEYPGSKRASVTLPFQSQAIDGASGNDGTAIDYYQRELLLLRNELYFSNYMQQLNKYQYTKLKLKMNRVAREAELHSQSIEHTNNLSKIAALEKSCKTLSEEVEQAQRTLIEQSSNSQAETLKLLDNHNLLALEKNELERKLRTVTTQLADLRMTSRNVIETLLPEKNIEISNLKLQLKQLKEEPKIVNVPTKIAARLPTPEPDYFSPNMVSETERKIHNLRTEIIMSEEKIKKLNREMSLLQDTIESNKKSYEQQISSLKYEISANSSAYVSQYERKIQDLSSTILKYEGLLEAKNSKIVQLSTSRPISIPSMLISYNTNSNAVPIAVGGNSSGGVPIHTNMRPSLSQPRFSTGTTATNVSTTYDMDSKARSNSRSNSSIDTTSSPPALPHGSIPSVNVLYGLGFPSNSIPFGHDFHLHNPGMPPRTGSSSTAASNVQPVIKGRGGYQKRSKKFM